MKKILVTGASGQLGSELQTLAPDYAGLSISFCNSKELDITDEAQVNRVLSAGYDVVVNTAAYTAVDKAETEKERAHAVNALGPELLANACRQFQTKLVHISTDFVFDGSINRPLREDDTTHPLSVYGETKLQGELAVGRILPDAIIIRTAWVYSTFGHNFMKTMLRLFNERPALNVVFDQVGTPTYARDLADVILQIISSGKWQAGIYHYSNEGVASWYDFAMAIARASHSKIRLEPIETSGYPTPARRPTYSVLNKQKIKSIYSLAIPHWQDSLLRCMELLHQKT